jgi:aryl-alcohol dehydrogenase-like predicted oxidoreductase
MTTVPARRRLGSTDLHVFPLSLGGNVFGWTADRATSFAVLDAYRAAGGNFIDTADVYSSWVPGHSGGESEQLLGEWLRECRCRSEMVVATKVGAGGPDLGPGLTAAQIQRGCDASLRRLRLDHIDLYYAHRDDPTTPLEESLGAFDALVRAGKVRWIGASNYTAPRLEAALAASAGSSLAAYAVVQPEYNLISRAAFEGPLAELCTARGLGVCTYYALASGFLTGKYGGTEKPASARAARVQTYLSNPQAVAALQVARAVAGRHGAMVAQVAIAWQLHRPEVTTPIASATSVPQLHELLGALRLALTAEDMAELDASMSTGAAAAR